MSWIQQVFNMLGQLLRWWFVVLPWEQAIRVRLGKHIRLCAGGLHFQIPFIDRVYVQNVRRRIAPIHLQTITTLDGKTVTIAGCLSYQIVDVTKLYQTLHQAEATIMQSVQGIVSDFVTRNRLADCGPAKIADGVADELDLSEYGLGEVRFFLTDFAVVRTFRLMSDHLSRYAGDELCTNQPVRADVPR